MKTQHRLWSDNYLVKFCLYCKNSDWSENSNFILRIQWEFRFPTFISELWLNSKNELKSEFGLYSQMCSNLYYRLKSKYHTLLIIFTTLISSRMFDITVGVQISNVLIKMFMLIIVKADVLWLFHQIFVDPTFGQRPSGCKQWVTHGGQSSVHFPEWQMV